MTFSDHALDEAMGDLLHGRMIDDTAHERPIGSLADAARIYFQNVTSAHDPLVARSRICVEPAREPAPCPVAPSPPAAGHASTPLDDLSQAPAPAPGH